MKTALGLLLVALAAGGCALSATLPAPTSTPTPTATPFPTATPTASPTPMPKESIVVKYIRPSANEEISATEMRVIRDALDEYELETDLKFSLVRDGEADVYVTVSVRQTKDACWRHPNAMGCAFIPGDEIWLRPIYDYPNNREEEFRITVKHELTHALFGLEHFEMPCAYLSKLYLFHIPRSAPVDGAVAGGDCGEREDLRELHLPIINIDGR